MVKEFEHFFRSSTEEKIKLKMTPIEIAMIFNIYNFEEQYLIVWLILIAELAISENQKSWNNIARI